MPSSMSALLFDLPVPTVPVIGAEGVFPVRRIYCIGRNYAAHTREMGGDPTRDQPIFFMKPGDAVAPRGRLAYPPDTNDLHHEVELVAAIGRGGANISVAAALDHVFGYAVGIDLTKRDRQAEAKAAGAPWERSKAFEHSAPISAILPLNPAQAPLRGRISLTVNGAVRQASDLANMIWTTAEIVSRLSQIWTLQPGDLIFTGTPEGVGQIAFGDVLEAHVENVGGLRVEIGSGA